MRRTLFADPSTRERSHSLRKVPPARLVAAEGLTPGGNPDAE